MSLEKLEHLRALADYLGKEVYALDYDESSGYFRLLPGPGAGLAPLARYRVFTADEARTQVATPTVASTPQPIRWPYHGTEFHIQRQDKAGSFRDPTPARSASEGREMAYLHWRCGLV